MQKVLVVDDEASLLEVIRAALAKEGYEVRTTPLPDEAIRMLREDPPDAVITDLKMSPCDGLQVLREAKAADPDIPVIMITAFGSVETAVEAMKQGAYDYIVKPFLMDELRLTIRRALERRGLVRENVALRRDLAGRERFDAMVGTSEAMQRVFRRIEKVADTDSTVLIYGESGTGKELVARSLHSRSSRRERPFVALSCGALPESLLESELFGHVKGSFTGAIANKDGLFKAADRGSIFLDEIGAMSPGLQASMLRVLQEREIKPVGATRNVKVDVRVISASNERLEDRMRAGTFREDLFYRLSVIPIELPALRERREDIPLLVAHFMGRALAKREGGFALRLGEEAARALYVYDWPGNVRELENAVERIAALSDGGMVLPEHLPDKIRAAVGGVSPAGAAGAGAGAPGEALGLREYVQEQERAHIERVLGETGGDKKSAARILGIDLATLYRKLDRRPGR